MGCNCDNNFEELEIQDGNNYQQSGNSNIENDQFNNNLKINFHKSSTLNPTSKAIFSKNKTNFDYLSTITENNEAINSEENNQEKKIIQEKDEEDEENIDKSKPTDEFSQALFDLINKLRENPHSCINLIQNSESNIQTDKHQRLIYKSRAKVALNNGLKAFEEAKLILSNTKPMEKLKYDYNMRIRMPKEEKNIKNKNYLKNQILIKNDNGIDIKAYWREIIWDPETCFILMVVDDNGKNSGAKRREILNPSYKYIGLNSKMINKSFACYITLK